MKDSNIDKDKLSKEEFDTETAAELNAADLNRTRAAWKLQGKYNEWVQNLPEILKALLIISWICAALAAFVSVYFAVLGIITSYAANRAAPGVGKAAMITNIVLAVLNILLSFAFLATVKNFFAVL